MRESLFSVEFLFDNRISALPLDSIERTHPLHRISDDLGRGVFQNLEQLIMAMEEELSGTLHERAILPGSVWWRRCGS